MLHRGREKDTHTVTETLVWDRITLALCLQGLAGQHRADHVSQKTQTGAERRPDMSAGSDASKAPRTLPSQSQCTRARTQKQATTQYSDFCK